MDTKTVDSVTQALSEVAITEKSHPETIDELNEAIDYIADMLRNNNTMRFLWIQMFNKKCSPLFVTEEDLFLVYNLMGLLQSIKSYDNNTYMIRSLKALESIRCGQGTVYPEVFICLHASFSMIAYECECSDDQPEVKKRANEAVLSILKLQYKAWQHTFNEILIEDCIRSVCNDDDDSLSHTS